MHVGLRSDCPRTGASAAESRTGQPCHHVPKRWTLLLFWRTCSNVAEELDRDPCPHAHFNSGSGCRALITENRIHIYIYTEYCWLLGTALWCHLNALHPNTTSIHVGPLSVQSVSYQINLPKLSGELFHHDRADNNHYKQFTGKR